MYQIVREILGVSVIPVVQGKPEVRETLVVQSFQRYGNYLW